MSPNLELFLKYFISVEWWSNKTHDISLGTRLDCSSAVKLDQYG